MAVATVFSDIMTSLTGNSGGGVQVLPPSYLVYGKRRTLTALITLAAQVAGTVIAVARLPLPSVITDITLLTDTSLGSSTIALGDANSANFLSAAATFTATDTPTKVGKTAALGVVQQTGYDSQSGAQVTPYAPGQGGAFYDDILLTTATATLPASGNLRIMIEFVID